MAGPFNGFTGIIDEIYEDKKKLKVVVKIFGRNSIQLAYYGQKSLKLKVVVKIFGRNTPIELNYFQVEKEY